MWSTNVIGQPYGLKIAHLSDKKYMSKLSRIEFCIQNSPDSCVLHVFFILLLCFRKKCPWSRNKILQIVPYSHLCCWKRIYIYKKGVALLDDMYEYTCVDGIAFLGEGRGGVPHLCPNYKIQKMHESSSPYAGPDHVHNIKR